RRISGAAFSRSAAEAVRTSRSPVSEVTDTAHIARESLLQLDRARIDLEVDPGSLLPRAEDDGGEFTIRRKAMSG
ncbi:hypothetical protein, partial [Streptomyces morookaense]